MLKRLVLAVAILTTAFSALAGKVKATCEKINTSNNAYMCIIADPGQDPGQDPGH